jgi:hypothetical protein
MYSIIVFSINFIMRKALGTIYFFEHPIIIQPIVNTNQSILTQPNNTNFRLIES